MNGRTANQNWSLVDFSWRLACKGMQGMPGMMNCPMNLQGTSVAVADTATGVTVTITTEPESVAELQKRVEKMAAMHSGQPSTTAMMQGQMMPGTEKFETIKDGARRKVAKG